MANKKILYFGNFDFPTNNASACRVLGVCHALTPFYECHCYGHSKTNVCSGEFDNVFYHNDNYPISTKDFIKRALNKKKIKTILKQYNHQDIEAIFFTTVPLLALNTLIKYCEKNHIPLIYDCGDMISFSRKNFIFAIASYIAVKIEKHKVKKHTKIMAISNYIASQYKTKKNIIEVIPCIGDSKSQRFAVEAQSNHQHQQICYCGDPGKSFYKDRLDLCLDSFIKYYGNDKTVNFVICGVDEKTLRLYGYHQPLPTNVDIKGKLPNKECIKIIKESDASILFRDDTVISKAGFPSKITESLLLKTPVITNITSDLVSYLNDQNSITINGYGSKTCDDLFIMIKNHNLSNIKESCTKVECPLESSKWADSIIKLIKAK